jgi:hypothetical protein
MAKGQVLMLVQDQDHDLVGSAIQSSKPVGVWAEDYCVTYDELACDGAHQPIPPVRALGHEYVGVRYRNRIDTKDEEPPYRMVGMVDGTALTYDPAAPLGAPTTLKLGEAVVFRSSTPFVVRSQDDKHPFYMAGFMTGAGGFIGNGGFVPCDLQSDPKCFGGRGDAEFVSIVPTEQYEKQYSFFTDPTYPETNLVFVRKRASDGQLKDVTLDCAGMLSGWQPIGNAGSYEYVRVDLSRHNFAPQGACDNGAHSASSDGPFGITVWGWGTEETGATQLNQPGYSLYVSYAYPAGASVQPINTVVVPPTPR